MFSVRLATCSIRYGKQNIIVSFDRFTSLSLVFRDRPWQIFSKVNLEALLWIFLLIRKSYTFHSFICVLLQIWRTTTGSIITPCTFGPTLFCNSIYYDVLFLSCISFLKAWFAADILWFLGKIARCWFVFTKFINEIMTSILVLFLLLCTINLKFVNIQSMTNSCQHHKLLRFCHFPVAKPSFSSFELLHQLNAF